MWLTPVRYVCVPLDHLHRKKIYRTAQARFYTSVVLSLIFFFPLQSQSFPSWLSIRVSWLAYHPPEVMPAIHLLVSWADPC